ncbi:hypothetical protein [Candidatus Uabimicrobium sp. HlEnr_7]|uniref:hypothetical protein n=1 Tax=Candidatus Uabimicrobium helgolandensis TaxID=3095367 RepID=UPI003556FCD0
MRLYLFLLIISVVFADESGLQSRNVEVRARAIAAIGSAQGKENFLILYKHSRKMNTIEKIAYMKVLGRWQGKECTKATNILINTLLSRRESRQVKIEAANSLATVVNRDQTLEDGKAKSRVKKAVGALKKGLVNTRNSYQVRESIIGAFTTIGGLDHIKVISLGLKDKYQMVRIRSIQAFRSLNAVDHVKLLIKSCLREKHSTIQKEYVETIYELNKEKGFPFFVKILNNRKNANHLRIRLIEMIASYHSEEFRNFHSKAVKAIAKCYPNETDLSTKKAVIRALGNFNVNEPSIRRIYAMTQKERDSLKELGAQFLK